MEKVLRKTILEATNQLIKYVNSGVRFETGGAIDKRHLIGNCANEVYSSKLNPCD